MATVVKAILAEGMDVVKESASAKKRTRDQSNAPLTSVEKALANIYREGDMIERKRLPPCRYRLHPAKYLQMDKMLASLFFPVQNMINHFGITSYTGVNDKDAEAFMGINKSLVGIMRTKGQYRGLALFDVRTTDTSATAVDANSLNADPKQLGAVQKVSDGSLYGVDSIYRSFHNGPQLTGGVPTDPMFDGATVGQTGFQTLVSDDTANQDQVRSCSMGLNLFQVEAASLNSMCYSDPIVSNGKLALPNSPVPAENNTETIPGQPTISASSNSLYSSLGVAYNEQVRDAVIRIIDGKLVMDIMNTENTPCVVEIVIHSKKKNNSLKQNIYNEFFKNAQYHYGASGKTANDFGSDANLSGGWQTFYDPEVPLLRLPKKSAVYKLVSEVHRSQHILAPGQSKLVTIDLGNLWYKLKNKNDLGFISQSAGSFIAMKDNVGSLYVAVGHSGFVYPQGINTLAKQSTTGPDALMYMRPQPDFLGNPGVSEQMPGTGWWTGLTHTPSSIAISGTYTEKFYPMTFDRSQTDNTRHMVPRGAYIDGGAGNRASVPTIQIVPEKVVVSDTSFKDNTLRDEL